MLLRCTHTHIPHVLHSHTHILLRCTHILLRSTHLWHPTLHAHTSSCAALTHPPSEQSLTASCTSLLFEHPISNKHLTSRCSTRCLCDITYGYTRISNRDIRKNINKSAHYLVAITCGIIMVSCHVVSATLLKICGSFHQEASWLSKWASFHIYHTWLAASVSPLKLKASSQCITKRIASWISKVSLLFHKLVFIYTCFQECTEGE